jgi:uncharacterized protein YacL
MSKRDSAHIILMIIMGLIIGLILATLLIVPLQLYNLSGPWDTVVPASICFILGVAGIIIMLIRGREILQALSSYLPSGNGIAPKKEFQGGKHIILDTSAIIDGRIADISQTGFVQGSLIIPRFVLDELRHIADSADSLRRNRGRRGLEMLSRLQKDSDIPIEISDVDFEDMQEVDAKLVQLGRILRCPILTNDFNLNHVAELQGVQVLNINELANAIKPVVLPGEELKVHVIQEGREPSQGVGFLDDGTMIVVEGGRRHINSHLNVIVAKVLQTAAGRMIFASLKPDKE